jgi:uncharacterized protein (TIGR02677 family)
MTASESDAPESSSSNAQDDAARTVPAINDFEVSPNIDEGRVVPFDGLLSVLEYTTAPTAEIYVAVMDAALDARDRFRLQLRPADIATVLNIDRDIAAAALNYLASKNALHRTYDASEAETLNEFYKGAFLYQLTPAGVAAQKGVREVLATRMATAGRLSAGLLPRIFDALGAIRTDADERDDSRLLADFTNLFAIFDELADSAATYLRELDAEIGDLAADSERLSAYKAAVLTYLQRFNRELNLWAPQIVGAIVALEDDATALLAAAAKVDAAPRPDGTLDDGPIERLTGRWDGTVSWFCPRGGRPATADYVSLAMIAAINRVLGAISRLHERRLRRVSREADFTQLAVWFAGRPGNAAHELWDATTGLWSARHFNDLAGDESVDRRRSFWDAGQAELPPRVRTAVRRGGPGRTAKRSDFSAVKTQARAQAKEAAEQAAAARERLAARTPARLSDIGRLDPGEFGAFLDVLGAALAEHARDGVRTAVLPGATIRIRAAGDAKRTTVRTQHGAFRGPDDIVEIDTAALKARRKVAAS